MLKRDKTPKSGRRVKFDASAIRSEGHALRKYANIKKKEYNEGKWLMKLHQMFDNDGQFQMEEFDRDLYQ